MFAFNLKKQEEQNEKERLQLKRIKLSTFKLKQINLNPSKSMTLSTKVATSINIPSKKKFYNLAFSKPTQIHILPKPKLHPCITEHEYKQWKMDSGNL